MKSLSINKKNLIWNFLGVSINSFNSLFFLVIINRINGENFGGIFSFSYSLICLLYFIGTYYSRAYQISCHSKKYSDKDFIANRILSCLLMLIITILMIFIFKYEMQKNIIIILICIYRLIEAISDVFYGIEQKNGKLYLSGISLFFKGIIGVLLFLVIDIITKDVFKSLISLNIINILLFIFNDIPKSKLFIKGKLSKINIIKIYKETFPIFIFSFLNIYLVNSTKYTLDIFEPNKLQNIFGIIIMPGTILSLCAQYILNPFLVELSNYIKNKEYKKFEIEINRICKAMLLFGIIIEIGCYLLGIPFLNIIYDINLNDYKIQLLFIILGSTFLALVAILSAALTIINKNIIQMIIYLISSILSFALSIILIKKFSLMGATLTYTIVMLIHFVLYYIFYKLNIKKMKKGEKNGRENK